ncbi:GatB/YqeY domain-containing protein [Thermoactinomyces intermedius]|uniref:GatB/YqeY domain-containing protein n=1 Tax=Thermoactinomyces intermedius TaxID=2024 RepID=A0A8I1DDL6_THEIN|nr:MULTISPECIES: GatB/YqeY domain-containing protein [Thermoactinomyces]MBA4547757.1 GatB/YqeY domain-containing protein [Thermoactinomyces intermedius]MBA4836632.1 GatB/YqeY domain-containing protein [Thermoactinomyces intermedius]MBH8594014.1 GatB/YqeY domain-containing protein [Thermoactinomyces intermedius]MBH8600063.1 GatB/YqeY domain-containing protein [Thermoactinomyces sp. CICC 23799]
MSLTNQLDQEMKMALKNKDKQKLSTIRMLKSAIKKEEIDKKRPLNDDEIISVIMREVKQRKDSLAEYKAAGRDDLAEKEQAEIDILSAYLPEQMSEEELKALVQQVIEEVGAGSKADMGKVMSAIMPKVKGRAEGRLVNRLVQEALQ